MTERRTLQSPETRGFSLLEMIIASLIFASVSIATLGFISHHHRAIGKARAQLLAQHLCRERLLNFSAAGWHVFNGPLGSTILPAGPEVLLESIPVLFEDRGGESTLVFQVWAQRTTLATEEQNIKVSVRWNQGALAREITYRTYLSRGGSI